MTIIQKAGYDVVSYPGVESVKGHPTMLFFTSGNLIQQDQKTVDHGACERECSEGNQPEEAVVGEDEHGHENQADNSGDQARLQRSRT